MPELPEVENVRRSLAPILLNARITGVRVLRRGFARRGGSARPAGPRALLDGARVRAVERHGKQLAILSDDGRAIAIHLGMTGQLLWTPGRVGVGPGARADHVHVSWLVESPASTGELRFRDPRRFGGVWTFPSFDALRRSRWSTLGPDALAITPGGLLDAARNSRRAIKALLLDQAVLAGVGNIYADEALFRARVAPHRRADSLLHQEYTDLAAAIRAVLTASIAAGGSTLRDYRDVSGSPGRFQHVHRVYARGGQPCVTCGGVLRRALVAQRTTVWCPSCQRRPLRSQPEAG